MKRLIIAATSVAAILIILSIVFGRLEPLLGLLGLGAISGNQIIKSYKTSKQYNKEIKTAGDKAAAEKRDSYKGMSDEEVIANDPVAKRAYDNALKRARQRIYNRK